MAQSLVEPLDNVSLLVYLDDTWTLVLGILILAVNLGLSSLHSYQERKGMLWRYFGAIAGLRIPDVLGKLGFFWGLTAVLWLLGLIGIAGLWTGTATTETATASAWIAMAAIGALSGQRVKTAA